MCFLLLRNGKEISRRAGLWGREGGERKGEEGNNQEEVEEEGEGGGQRRGGRGG